MSKVTDEEILTMKALADSNKVTVEDSCKSKGITRTTFYRRLGKLTKQSEQVTEALQKVASAPITIQALQSELQSIISELKEMKGRDTREQLQIMDRKINALDKLNNTLKTTSIMIDNRTVNVEIRKTIETDVCQWVYDTVLSKGGPELASKVLDMLQGD